MGKSSNKYRNKEINHTNNKKMINKVYKKIILLIVFLIAITCGLTYGFFSITYKGDEKVKVVAGIFQVEFKESNTINLENATPMTDNEGMQTDEYEFSIENTGDIDARYNIGFEENNITGNTIDKKYIKYSIKEDNGEWSSPQLLSNGLMIRNERILNTGEKVNYKLKMWLIEEASNEVEGKTFSAKIIVSSVQNNSNVSDNISPVINIANTYIEKKIGESFTDPVPYEIKDNKQNDIDISKVEKTYEYYDGVNISTVDYVDTNKKGIYYIYYRVSDSKGNIGCTVVSIVVNNNDFGNIPTITLNGNEKIEVGQKEIYQELGAEAVDIEDGIITEKIITLGEVNTNVEGMYILKYIIIDSDGNIASASRIVDVVHKGSIEITPGDITKNNSKYNIPVNIKSTSGDIVGYYFSNSSEKPVTKDYYKLDNNTNNYDKIFKVKDTGTYYIWVYDTNNNVESKEIVVTDISNSSNLEVTKDIIDIEVDGTDKIEVTGNEGDLIYETDNDNSTVDPDGNVIGNDVGETIVTITDTETGETITIKVHIYKNVYVSYVKNGLGVSSIGELTDENIKCKLTYKNPTSCEITLPNMEVTNDYIALGWSQNSEAKQLAEPSDISALNGYQEIAKKVAVSTDTTYYSISKKEGKTYTATFTKNGKGIKGISSTTLSCSTDVYNNETESDGCSVVAPSIEMEEGYTVYGWSDDSQAKVKYVTMDFIEGNYRCIYDTEANQFISSTTISTGENVSGLYQYLNNKIATENINTTDEAINMYKNFFGSGMLTYDIKYEFDYISINDDILLTKNATYYTVSKKNVVKINYHFMPNGASGNEVVKQCVLGEAWNNEEQSDICDLYNIPGINKTGYNILGYSKNKDAYIVDDENDISYSVLESAMSQGLPISIKYDGNNDVYYYAITHKRISINWNANNAVVSSTISSCDIYNTESSCVITSPTIEREGFNVIGFSKNIDATMDDEDIWNVNTSKSVTIEDDGSTYYSITSKSKEAVFHYYDYDTAEYKKVNATCYTYSSDELCNYEIPSEVINSTGPNGFKYRGLSKAEDSDELVNIINSNSNNYYAVYSEDVDVSIIYYNGSNQDIITVSSYNNALAKNNQYELRNSIVDVPDQVIYSKGLDNSSYIGLSIDPSNNSVVQNITTDNTNYYAVYKGLWTINFIKDDNSIDSIGSTKTSCNFYQTSDGNEYDMSKKSCKKQLPSINASVGYDNPAWYDGDISIGVELDNYEISQNKTLVAKATTKLITVSYNCEANGGECSIEPEKIPYGSSANLSYSASKEGYDFIGWNIDSNSTEKLIELNNVVSDVTLYAIYNKSTDISLNSKLVEYNGTEISANEAVLSDKLDGYYITYDYYNDSSCSDKISIPIDAGGYYVQASAQKDGDVIKSNCISHTIIPRKINISWDDKTNLIYNRESQAPSYMVSNTLDIEELELKQSKEINSGNYTSNLVLLSVIGGRGKKENYELINNSIKYTITPANGYVELSSYSDILNHGIDSISFSILETHGGEISIDNLTDYDISIDHSGDLVTLSRLNNLKRGSILKIRVTSAAIDNYYSASADYNLYIKSPPSIVDAVARIDDEYYSSLEEALDDAKPIGDTIVMLKSTSESVINNKDVTIDLGGTTITGVDDYTIINNGTLKIINDGAIENNKSTVLVNNGILTLGDDDGEVSQGYPYISGVESGIDQNGTYNFYDGLITAKVGIVGSVNTKPSDYYVYIDHDSSNDYQKVYLVKDIGKSVVKSVPTSASIAEIYYYNLQDAFNSYNSDVENLIVLRDFEAAYELSILENQNIKLDISGYTLSTGYTLTNDGTLILKDTGRIKGSIKSSVSITNNSSLYLENITINETTNSNVVENSGTLTLTNSYINATSGNGVKALGGSVVTDENSLIKSSSGCALFIDIDNYVLDGGNYESTNNYGVCTSKNVTINNVNITGYHGIENSGKLKINNASINVDNFGIENYSTMEIDYATINGRTAIYNNSYNDLIVNDGSYYGTNYAYYSFSALGNVKLLGGTYLSDKDNAVYYYGSSYTSDLKYPISLTIGSSESVPVITSNGSNGIYADSLKNFTINNGIINGSTNGVYSSYSNLSVYDGDISGINYGIYNSGKNIIIGNINNYSDTNYNPIIVGKTYGIYLSNSYAEMYSGIIKGQIDSIYGTITKFLNGYKPIYDVEEIEAESYKTVYLKEVRDYLKVGDTYYNTLEKAINAITDEDIIEVVESELDSSNATISNNKKIILDLNGHTIETSNRIVNNGDFTIRDSSTDNSGKIIMKSSNEYIVYSKTSSNLLIESGNFESNGYGFFSTNGGDITISNANITTKLTNIYLRNGNMTIYNGTYYSVKDNVIDTNNSNLTIIDGDFSNDMNYGSQVIYFSANSGVSVTGHILNANITGNEGNIISGSELIEFTIDNINIDTNNCSITAGLVSNLNINNGIIRSKNSYAISVYSIYRDIEGEVNIYGGTIISENNYGVYYRGGKLNIGKKDDIMDKTSPVIIGNTYGLYNTAVYNDSDISLYDGILKGKTSGYYGSINTILDDCSLAVGEELIDQETYLTAYLEKQWDFLMVNGEKYRSFKDAINAISSEGTITVLGNYMVTEIVEIPSDKEITIDLSGNTLSFLNSITNNGSLTIIDSSEQNTGSLLYIGTTDFITSTNNITLDNIDINSGGIGKLLTVSGTCKIIGGNYSIINNSSSYGIDIAASTEVEIDGVTITGGRGINNAGTTTIKNASISSDYYAIYNNNGGVINILDGDYTTSSANYVIYNDSNSKSIINIGSETTIPTITYSIENSSYYNNSAISNNNILNIYNGVISSSMTGIISNGTANIYGGEIYAIDYGIYLNGGNLNIGDKNNSVNTTSPLIMSDNLAVREGFGENVNYYDGVLKESNYNTNNLLFSDVASGYTIDESEENIDGNNYYVTSLKPCNNVIQNGDIIYSDIQTAIDEAENGDILTLIDDAVVWYEINISSDKEFTLDLSGHNISLLNYLNNMGFITIYDSSVKVGKIESKKTTKIRNYSTLNIDDSIISVEINNGSQGNSDINAEIVINNAIINNGIYNYSNCDIIDSIVNIEYWNLNNANKDSTMTISGSSIINNSTSRYAIENGGEAIINSTNLSSNKGGLIKNTNKMVINDSTIENSGYSAATGIFASGGTTTIQNTSIEINTTSTSSSSKAYAIILSGSTLVTDNLDINMNVGEYGYGIYSTSSDDSVHSTIVNTNINVNSGIHGYGIYSGGKDTISFETGNINIYTTFAYGIYVKTGTVVMGVKDGDGTENATVSNINPEVKAIHSKSWGVGYGVRKENGYFKFYDGKIIGSTNAKPDTTTEVEYNYEANSYIDSKTGYEYCILEYMK